MHKKKMARGETKSQNNFDLLLQWLDKDRTTATDKYQEIRLRLTKIFYSRGCHLAEELADETIERVITKVATVSQTFEGDPAIYFYAVGKNVFREWTRKPKTDELPPKISVEESNFEDAEIRDRCLTDCMGDISTKQAEFIIEYYKREKADKIQLRKQMAQDLEITPEALRVRAFRIRNVLQKCVLRCVEKQKL